MKKLILAIIAVSYITNIYGQITAADFDGKLLIREEATFYDDIIINESIIAEKNNHEWLFYKDGIKCTYDLSNNESTIEINNNSIILRNEIDNDWYRQIKLYNNGNAYFSGKITAEDIEVKPYVSIPDYVFENDYKLRTLQEVESFIKKEKHLPDVPKGQQLQAGYNVSEMNMILLKKVEELTLYMIDLKKENEKLLSRVKKLEPQ
jgi:hypothetical protein